MDQNPLNMSIIIYIKNILWILNLPINLEYVFNVYGQTEAGLISIGTENG